MARDDGFFGGDGGAFGDMLWIWWFHPDFWVGLYFLDSNEAFSREEPGPRNRLNMEKT